MSVLNLILHGTKSKEIRNSSISVIKIIFEISRHFVFPTTLTVIYFDSNLCIQKLGCNIFIFFLPGSFIAIFYKVEDSLALCSARLTPVPIRYCIFKGPFLYLFHMYFYFTHIYTEIKLS